MLEPGAPFLSVQPPKPIFVFEVPIPGPGMETETSLAFNRTLLYLKSRPELVGIGIVLKEPAKRRVKFVGRFKRSFPGFTPAGAARFKDLAKRLLPELGRGRLELIWEPKAEWIEWKIQGRPAKSDKEIFTIEIQIFKPAEAGEWKALADPIGDREASREVLKKDP